MRFRVPVLALEGHPTDDGRQFQTLTHRELPLTLFASLANTMGHDGAPIAGSIDEITREDDGVLSAIIDTDDDGEAGIEAARLIQREDLRGISIDAIPQGEVREICLRESDRADDEECLEIGVEFEEGIIGGATLTGLPAFEAANQIDPTPLDQDDDEGDDGGETSDEFAALAEALGVDVAEAEGIAAHVHDWMENVGTLAVTGQVDLPVAGRDTGWDGDGAQDRVFAACSNDDDEVDADCVSRAFLFRDDDADPNTQQAYKLGFADVIDGELRIVPAGVVAVASVLSGGRGGVSLPEDARDRIESRVCSLYDRIRDSVDDEFPACPFEDDDASADTEGDAEAVTAAAPPAPPAAWFTDPQLPGPSPVTVTNEGRILGHAAAWGTCHTGFDGVCITPPSSPSGYAFFRTGEIGVDTGDRVPVGTITMDTGHASKTAGARGAAAHYDDTGTAVADVTAGEDAHGIWISGAVRPHILEDAEKMRALQAAALSGDWRRIGGQMEMVGLLAVNVPGFPVSRVASGEVTGPTAYVEDGRQVSLVASGIVAHTPTEDEPDIREVVSLAVNEALDAREQRAALADLDEQVAPARHDALARLDQRVRDT